MKRSERKSLTSGHHRPTSTTGLLQGGEAAGAIYLYRYINNYIKHYIAYTFKQTPNFDFNIFNIMYNTLNI